MLTVYLACSSAEPARVRRLAAMLDKHDGITITLRWWLDADLGQDATLTDAEQARRAQRDLAGILAADVVWCLFPERFSHGALFELGYAFTAGLARVIVTGPNSRSCIFTSLFERFDGDESGLSAIPRAAHQRTERITIGPGDIS